METMKVQAQIRQNAEEVSSYLTDLSKWEKTINKRDKKAPATGGANPNPNPKALPVRLGSGTVKVIEKAITNDLDIKGTAAGHTYDVGYKKWEKFNVEAALADQDNIIDVDDSNDDTENLIENENSNTQSIDKKESFSATNLTPASLVKRFTSTSSSSTSTRILVPAARGIASTKDAETGERERGNAEYESGNFTAAVKSYTKCLGMKSKNYVAFSNRAMAYIKLKEFIRAETDCSSALNIEPFHVKSLIRRATSRNFLGKHRAALADLNTATSLEATNKQVRGEIQRTRELLRNTTNRAPLVSLITQWENESEYSSHRMQGPDMPYTDNKEFQGQNDVSQSQIDHIDQKEEQLSPKSTAKEAQNEIKDSKIPQTPNLISQLPATMNALNTTESSSNKKEAWEYIPKEKSYDGSIYSDPHSESESDFNPNPNPDPNPTPLVTKTIKASNTVEIEKTNKTKKLKKKNKKEEKEEKPKILKGYELERELKLCTHNDVTLDRLMFGLKPSFANEMFGDILEVDVIVSFLGSLARWNEMLRKRDNNSDVNSESDSESKAESNTILLWFEAISKVSTFRILKLLLTENQKEFLVQLLLKSSEAFLSKSGFDAPILMEKKIEDIRLLWQL